MSIHLPPLGMLQVYLPEQRIANQVWRTGRPAGRIGDRAQSEPHAHGCPACPHTGVGPAVTGSHNVFVNNRPALRVHDSGVAAACCGSNLWRAVQGTSSVLINDRQAHRKGDGTEHCGYAPGRLIEGSPDVCFGHASPQSAEFLGRSAHPIASRRA
jgi:uncharacterized Zn-binding protein involved in type VI secretion